MADSGAADSGPATGWLLGSDPSSRWEEGSQPYWEGEVEE